MPQKKPKNVININPINIETPITNLALPLELASNFNPNKSVAVIADRIDFAPAVTQAKGIFIANTVMTGTINSQGLRLPRI